MPLASIALDLPRAVTPSEAALTRRVDLTTLRLFVAICDEQNLTRAAQREGIAASAVSKRMNDFELAFGVTLFKRLAKGMALTPAGEALLHHARVTLLNVEKIAVELSEYSEGVRGHVRMLANLSAIVQFLPEDLSAFFGAHELLRVDLQERPSGQVVRGIEEGAAEIGICSGEADVRGLESFHYRHDNLVVVTRADHPLAGRGDVAFIDTLDHDYIGLHTASSIYLRCQYAATQAGQAMRLRINVPGFDAVCRMVQANMGIGLIPDRAFEVVGAGMGLSAVPLRDDWGRRALKIVVREAANLSSTGKLMLEHLRAVES
ncbi:LysR family transcriptional regulator [Bradyrhizobium jicamae]|uniref:LysR substrate-binding domain-containing protein n=1 Tax=Bradyrhizobium jicamae TaxID=280332 RepID=UPI001BA44582|nr:LysR substrate-binding domain-containing protein [Bradyrhizobium jicamae]MBR0751557.1 LysR family transcriptional regulator [Bradyrhizobium jicamae]